MADDQNPPTPPSPPPPRKIDAKAMARSTKLVKVDLHNPTHARRIIDAADETHTKIQLDPGETRRNVDIAEWVARELKSRTKGHGKANSDLHVYPAGQAPDPSSNPSDEDDDDGDDE